MSESLLALDPGEVTGWSLWVLDDDAPLQRLDYGLIHGGTFGAAEWLEQRLGVLRPDILVCERWNRFDGRAGDPTYPLQIEGLLIGAARALGLEITWQSNGMKDLCRDSTLKEFGFYIMPAAAKVDPAIMWEDARDVNDSQRHALAWAKAADHEPTVTAFWPEAQ